MLQTKYLYFLFLFVFAFTLNWFSGNTGVIPIDTFGFFDTGYSILKNNLPIKDVWIHTGLVVDYIQSVFFLLLGNSWNSYLAHSSIFNAVTALVFYLFLTTLKISKNYSLIYALSFSILAYPVIGTPFAYLHAYLLCVVSLICLSSAINSEKFKLWILIPILLFFAFFSMQTPSAYIVLLVGFFGLVYLINSKKYIVIKYIIFGIIISLIIFVIFLYLTDTSLRDLVYQYFLFPLSIGESRLKSEIGAYVKLQDQLNLKRIFGEFKFIYFFLIPLIILNLVKFKKKKIDKIFLISLLFILSTIIFIFNQLTQANQIYIFSLIPILAAILHINLIEIGKKKYVMFFLLILVFVSIKYHHRYNVERKFIDLENINKASYINAIDIHEKLKGLKWVTGFSNPSDDKKLLKLALETIRSDNSNILIITHYQFFLTLLNDKNNINILNRWYIWDNNSHPTENHELFDYYQAFATKKFKDKKIKTIYLVGNNEEFTFENIKNYFVGMCFETKNIVENRLLKLSLIQCNN